MALKQRNPRFGCPRIAQQLAKAFGIPLNKGVVRRVLTAHYRPSGDGGGPSWLTLLGQAKQSSWSLDLFRVESIQLKTHWILVVMNEFTCRIIGLGVQAVVLDGVALCRMFNQAIAGQGLPVRLSLDHDLLFGFHRGKRICGFSRSRRFKPFCMCPSPTRSLSASSAPSGASIGAGCIFGTSVIGSRNWKLSKVIKMGTVSTRDWLAKRQTKQPPPTHPLKRPTSRNTPGSHTATGILNSQSLHEYHFAMRRVPDA